MVAKHTIVLTEDSQEDAMVIQEIFKRSELPFDLVHINDGESLMDFVTSRDAYFNEDGTPKYLILLDLMMPKKDGIECLEEIRSNDNKDIRNLPIVIFSGSECDEHFEKTMALGANSFIPKPRNVKEVKEMFAGLADQLD
ncbi:MAG: response regulator [Alphaproteobacteria bacterium]